MYVVANSIHQLTTQALLEQLQLNKSAGLISHNFMYSLTVYVLNRYEHAPAETSNNEAKYGSSCYVLRKPFYIFVITCTTPRQKYLVPLTKN